MRDTWKAMREAIKIATDDQLQLLNSNLTTSKQNIEQQRSTLEYENYIDAVGYYAVFIAIVRVELNKRNLEYVTFCRIVSFPDVFRSASPPLQKAIYDLIMDHNFKNEAD